MIIKHTFKSYTDREDTGPWRGLHCVSEDKNKRRSLHARLDTGKKPALTVLPPTLKISPIDKSFKGCGHAKASRQLHVHCTLSAAQRLRARGPDVV